MGIRSSKPKPKAPPSFYSIIPPSPSLPLPPPSPNARMVALRSYLQELKETVSNTHPNYTGLKAALNNANNANNNGKIKGLFERTLNDYVFSLIIKKDPGLLLDLLQTFPDYKVEIENSILNKLHTLLFLPKDNETSFIFLEAFPDLINRPTSTGQTLLHTAARKNNREAINLLLRLGEPDIVNRKDSDGLTPYSVAGSIDTQALLVSYGATPIDTYNRELLNTFTGKVVLAQSNEDTISTFRRFIVLQLIAFIRKHEKLEVPENVPNKNKTRRFLAPLYKTNSDQGSLVMAISTYFLEDDFYTRCLRTYKKNEYEKPQGNLRDCVIKTLTAIIHPNDWRNLKKSATIKSFFDNLAKLYAYIPEDFRNHPEKKLNLNIQDDNGRTMLHWAVVTQNLEMIRLLLQMGANYSISDYNGVTCINYITNIPEDIQLLLREADRPDVIEDSDRKKILLEFKLPVYKPLSPENYASGVPNPLGNLARSVLGGGPRRTRSKRRNRSKTKRHPRK